MILKSGTSASWNHQSLYKDCFFRIIGINMTDEFQDALQKSQNLLHPSLHTIYVPHYSIFCLRTLFNEGLLPLFPNPQAGAIFLVDWMGNRRT